MPLSWKHRYHNNFFMKGRNMRYRKSFYKSFCIHTVIFILILPCHSSAKKTIQKTYCMSAISFDNTDTLKKELLLNAKRQAVNEIFGEMITAFTKVESGILTEDKIRMVSAGFIRVKGNPIFQNGSNFAEVCVSIETYTTEEDKKKFQLSKITKKYCATKPELTTKQLKEFAKEQVVISALTDYDRKLKNHKDNLATLVHQIKYLETGFVPETETYCVKFEGLIYPIELLIALETDKTNVGRLTKGKVIKQWVSKVYGYSNQYDNGGWSARQVIGPPNVSKCGDIRGGWATNNIGGENYIEVGYDNMVYPTKLIVRENNSVGFVTKLEFLDPDGKYRAVIVDDKLTDCPGDSVFDIPEYIDFPVDHVKIYINVDHTSGYEEIDAIALEGYLSE